MNNKDTQILMTEHLSALLDDEAGSFEQKRILDELKSNQELCQKLSCYALIGETMRSGNMDKPAVKANANFLAGIHEQIEVEDQYHEIHVENQTQNNSAKAKSWLRPIGGFALAASVAAVAVLGLQNYQQLNSTGVEMASIQNPSEKIVVQPLKDQLTESEMKMAIVMPVNTMVATSDAFDTTTEEYKQADSRTRSLLKRYVDSHMQYASTASFVPSVRAIAYTDNQ